MLARARLSCSTSVNKQRDHRGTLTDLTQRANTLCRGDLGKLVGSKLLGESSPVVGRYQWTACPDVSPQSTWPTEHVQQMCSSHDSTGRCAFVASARSAWNGSISRYLFSILTDAFRSHLKTKWFCRSYDVWRFSWCDPTTLYRGLKVTRYLCHIMDIHAAAAAATTTTTNQQVKCHYHQF